MRASQTDTVDRQRLLDAGANKVEVLSDTAPIPAAPEEDVLDKFDGARLRRAYEDFCAGRGIDDVELGIAYLNKIDRTSCGI